MPTRAARAYLDIAFFHPYPDGNARLALLVLAHVLHREGIRLDEVGPLQTTRYADDPNGALDLATLITVLIQATHSWSTTRCERNSAEANRWAHSRALSLIL
ncbi:hypothetical protein [Kitasatospora sp. MBT63]|uniref:hypothetical protein n=1 Tax=Kitasatospora sp. MBT63 TaxID=1444768 RepID=UPI0034CD52DE